jgi:hypothetical protein
VTRSWRPGMTGNQRRVAAGATYEVGGYMGEAPDGIVSRLGVGRRADGRGRAGSQPAAPARKLTVAIGFWGAPA